MSPEYTVALRTERDEDFVGYGIRECLDCRLIRLQMVLPGSTRRG